MKDFLILKGCGHQDEDLEIENIENLAKLYK
jgi:hypothetical protein